MLADRTKKIDVSGIRKVFALAAQLKDPVNVSIGQPDFDVPAKLKNEAIKAIQKGMNRYSLTQGIPQLITKVKQKINKENKIKLKEENIFITSGVSGGIFLAYLSLLNPGDEVIMFDPYFVMYKHLASLIGAKPVFVDSYPDFLPDARKLEKAVTKKTKMIVINSPNNPTGIVYPEKVIRQIAAVAKKHDLILLSDEIYEKFNFTRHKHFSPASIYPKTVTLGGFSKAYAMTGWRLGWAAGPKEIINEMIKIQQYTFVCAPTPFQAAAIAALDYNMSSYIKKYKVKNELVKKGVHKSYEISPYTGGAFYMFLKSPQKTASAFVEDMIQKHKLLIIPGNVFSEKDTHFRISYASPNAVLRKAVKILNLYEN